MECIERPVKKEGWVRSGMCTLSISGIQQIVKKYFSGGDRSGMCTLSISGYNSHLRCGPALELWWTQKKEGWVRSGMCTLSISGIQNLLCDTLTCKNTNHFTWINFTLVVYFLCRFQQPDKKILAQFSHTPNL